VRRLVRGWKRRRRATREDRIAALELALQQDDQRIAEIEAAKTERDVIRAWARGAGFSWLRVKESDVVFFVIFFTALTPVLIIVLLILAFTGHVAPNPR
jgi:hypothetical protein